MKNLIVLHHSATKDSASLSWTAIEAFHKSWKVIDEQHVQTAVTEAVAKAAQKKGKPIVEPWKDIGYHYGIEKVDGKVAVLVGRPEDERAAAVAESVVNETGIHICIVGNFDEVEPDADVIEALVARLIVPLRRRHPVPLKGILGHNYFAPYKTCPGTKFDLKKLQDMVLAAGGV